MISMAAAGVTDYLLLRVIEISYKFSLLTNLLSQISNGYIICASLHYLPTVTLSTKLLSSVLASTK